MVTQLIWLLWPAALCSDADAAGFAAGFAAGAELELVAAVLELAGECAVAVGVLITVG